MLHLRLFCQSLCHDPVVVFLKQQLNIPETAAVDFQIGEEYYWDAAEASVIPVTVYENGVCVAGAHISKETKELMRSIMTYQP